MISKVQPALISEPYKLDILGFKTDIIVSYPYLLGMSKIKPATHMLNTEVNERHSHLAENVSEQFYIPINKQTMEPKSETFLPFEIVKKIYPGYILIEESGKERKVKYSEIKTSLSGLNILTVFDEKNTDIPYRDKDFFEGESYQPIEITGEQMFRWKEHLDLLQQTARSPYKDKIYFTVFLGEVTGGYSRTLSADYIGFNQESGWTISGEIYEDHYTWVEDFEANHPVYGRVFGNFEYEVYADSEEGYNHFLKHHPYEEWDKGDI